MILRHATTDQLFASSAGFHFAAGDNIALMNALPDGCVDLVLGSPPYENQRSYGKLQFKLKGQDWVDWMVEVMRAAVRITRGLVIMVVGHGKTRHYQWSATPALLMADLKRAGFCLRAPTLFERVGISGSGGKDYFRYDYEFAVTVQNPKYALGKPRKREGKKGEGKKGFGRLPWANPLAFGTPPKFAPGGAFSHRLRDGARVNQWGGSPTGGGNRRAEGSHDGRMPKVRPSHHIVTVRHHHKADGLEEQHYIPPELSNPGAVIQRNYTSEEVEAILALYEAGDVAHCNVGGGQMGHKLAHDNEAPFPLELADRYVLSFVPPGGVVLDPFNGSGTTTHSAIENRRRAIGFDLRADQVELAAARLLTIEPRLFIEADQNYERYVKVSPRERGERRRIAAAQAAEKEGARPPDRAEGEGPGLFDGLGDPPV